ncbi:unnamed protein product [Bursaphelenchus okinawaensis]|uniref:Uncharacterized protein n=1 Tax=Bursaphelenchus okinawaensis TaxID=465554 RepID=A0A811KDF7_9BILA|nr:unnamed protein product [Bursaphelenchus okinawaensis]CAG9101541.1 unnamed protein product [Bursaphelenchus okinawaensis]
MEDPMDKKSSLKVDIDLDHLIKMTEEVAQNISINLNKVVDPMSQYLANSTFNATVHDVASIAASLKNLTANMVSASNAFYQPWIFIVAVVILLLLILILAMFCLLLTRRELIENPCGKKKKNTVRPRPEDAPTVVVDDHDHDHSGNKAV